MRQRVQITKLASGVPGLDAVNGGGLPEYSFNLIAGGPGAGKTTLANQIMFANATVDLPALYITILGEPPLKMLRYQQQYSFFDPEKIPGCIRFLHLGNEVLEHGLEKVLDRIIHDVEETSPKLVFVDSFRSVVRKAMQTGEMELQNFVQHLSLHLTGWEATTFLIGEYQEGEADCNPVFTIADGIYWLSQTRSRGSSARTIQVVKMRGQGPLPGQHTLKISEDGIRVYPRHASLPIREGSRPAREVARRATGVAGLDEMMGGGIPAGYSVMLLGPSGSGKTTLSTRFIREGIEHGEPGVIALFEQRPEEPGASHAGSGLDVLVEEGKLKLISLRRLDLSVDETMEEIATAVTSIGAKRLVIDSLSGFELAVAPPFREDFREALYRMVGGLVQLGLTVMMTAEVVESYNELQLSPHGVSFLVDGIILQRCAELDGRLRRFLLVAKMRGFAHSNDFRFYDIGPDGIVVGETLSNYEGFLRGRARRIHVEE